MTYLPFFTYRGGSKFNIAAQSTPKKVGEGNCRCTATIDFRKFFIDGMIDDEKVLQICGMPKNEIPDHYRKTVTSEKCSICDFDYDKDICEKFENLNLREKRQIDEKITEAEYDTVIAFFKAQKFEAKPAQLDANGNMLFQNQKEKDNKIHLNFFSLILNLYISELLTDIKSTWENGFFWEIDSGKDTMEKLSSLLETSPYLIGKSEMDLKDSFQEKPKVRVEN